MSKDRKLAISLNLIGVVVLLISGVLFARLALILRGEEELHVAFDNSLLVLLGSVLVVVAVVGAHFVELKYETWSVC